MKKIPINQRFLNTSLIQNFESLSRQQQIDITIELLKLPEYLREQNEIELLGKSLMKIKFFIDLLNDNDCDLDTLHSICKKLTYQKFLKNEVVCALNSIGREFYIILNGKVGVNVINKHNNDDINSSIMSTSSLYLTTASTSILNDNKNINNGNFNEVDEIIAGGAFGELALIPDQDAYRQAIIICKEDTDLAVLSKIDYKETLAKLHTKLLESKIEFFSSLPIFIKESRRNMTSLAYHFHQFPVNRNDYIFKEGDENDKMYVIKKGEIKLLKTFDYPKTEDEREAELRGMTNNFKHPLNLKKKFEITVLTTGEIFGEEDVFFNKKYTTSAICSSVNAEIYAISKDEMFKRFKTSENIMKFVNYFCKKKKQWREDRLNLLQSIIKESKNLLWKKNSIKVKPQNQPITIDEFNDKELGDTNIRLDNQNKTLSPIKNTHKNLSSLIDDKPSGSFSLILKEYHLNSPSSNDKKNVKFPENTSNLAKSAFHNNPILHLTTPASMAKKYDIMFDRRPTTSPIKRNLQIKNSYENRHSSRYGFNNLQVDNLDKSLVLIEDDNQKAAEESKSSPNKSGVKEPKHEIVNDTQTLKKDINDQLSRDITTLNKRFTSRPEPIYFRDLEGTTVTIKAKAKLLSEIDKKPFELQFYKLGELPTQKKKTQNNSIEVKDQRPSTTKNKDYRINTISSIKDRLARKKKFYCSELQHPSESPNHSIINYHKAKLQSQTEVSSPLYTEKPTSITHYEGETDSQRPGTILTIDNQTLDPLPIEKKSISQSPRLIENPIIKTPAKVTIDFNDTKVDDSVGLTEHINLALRRVSKTQQKRRILILKQNLKAMASAATAASSQLTNKNGQNLNGKSISNAVNPKINTSFYG